MQILLVIAFILAALFGFSSLATSFILWDWQWVWESNTGWRVLIFMMLSGGGGASAR